ncbi:MAG: A/G-specific adenine glycosylase [Desulfobacterales bacterium]
MTFIETNQVRKLLVGWYLRHHRRLPWRETKSPYRIWVSEVMLQQTQVKTVLPYYQQFLRDFPEVRALANADLQTVLKAWEGLGYYARARNMHRAAKVIVQKHHGKFPDSWKTLKELPGVGEYIASAVLSIAFNQPYAVVDGNVKRVLSRFREISDPVNKSFSYKIFKTAAEELLDRRQPGMFNQALMELGALVCKPKKPNCRQCPIHSQCRAYQTGRVEQFPKRIQSPITPLYHIAVGVVYKNSHMLITRRKSEGLLGGLWEFPGGKVKQNEKPEKACIREIKEEVNLKVAVDRHISQVKHAYTHFKILMDVFLCRYVSGEVKLNGPEDFRWITLQEIDQYPFPKANHKFIHLLS